MVPRPSLREQAVESAVAKLTEYLSQDPDQNLDRMIAIARRLAIAPNHREIIDNFTGMLEDHPSIREYMTRVLTETHPNCRQKFMMNLAVKSSLLGIPKHAQKKDELGVNVPYTILIDPTEACNLRCTGCWAGKYKASTLPYEVLDRIIREAKELGIHFFVLSGGEPFAYPHLMRLIADHQDAAFMVYTNGTLITAEVADKLQEYGNLSPAISLEGFRESTDARRGEGTFDRVMQTMDLLKERGIPFGYSVTVTKNNIDEVFGDAFIDAMIDKGALYGWSFHYVPVGRDPDLDLLISPEQRLWLAERVVEVRMNRPIVVMDFWNDGEQTLGCIAGGRRYFHITADGYVEPCAFAHFRADSIMDKSLVEVLGSPLFGAFQKYQPVDGNLLLPCPIIDRPHLLRKIVAESEAKPSYPAASQILTGEMAEFLDERSQSWEKVAEPLWQERELKRCAASQKAATR